MIAYTMVGTADLARASGFYEPLLTRLGLRRDYEDDAVTAWGNPDNPMQARFFVTLPFDGNRYGVGNGTMTAFHAPDATTIDALHAQALATGGSSEGDPGYRPRYGPGVYAAYIRDPDGNKIAFICYDT